MKKVININLGGRLINIEEDAWAKLQQYMESLKRHFASEEGRDEIIGDIENRIAEIFADKQKKGVTAIADEDVEEVMSSIGRPEDFDADPDNNTTAGAQYEKQDGKVKRGRLFRNSDDKAIGGVCSGIAAYFNVDVSLVRIIWAVLVFAGGTGILLYILLWIVVPERKVETTVERRLFRNPDERMIGGVCGGLASYFGVDVWIPRLVFAFPFLISIIATIFKSITHDWGSPGFIFTGSFGGTTLIAYIILWLVIPEAGTVSEKMAMRGEKVDLNSIKSNIQEEMKSFGAKAEKWGRDINERSREWGSKVNTGMRRRGGGVANALGMIIKGFFLFIGGIIAFGLLVAMLALLTSGIGLMPFTNFFFDGFWQTFFGWSTFLFFLLVPLLGLIVWLVRRARRAKRNRSITAFFIFLWTFGFISVTCFTATVVRDFSVQAEFSDSAKLVHPTGTYLRVAVKENASHSRRWIQYGGLEKITSDSIQASFIGLSVEMSPDNDYHLIVKRTSFGRNEATAESYAANIRFGYQQQDSTLWLDRYFTITRPSKFRGQHVNLVLQVPKGAGYVIDESVDEQFNIFSHGRHKHRIAKKLEIFDEPNWKANQHTIMSDEAKPAAPPTENLQEREQQLNEELKQVQEKKKQMDVQRRADSIKRNAQKQIDSLNKATGAVRDEDDDNDRDGAFGDEEAALDFDWPTSPFFSNPLNFSYPSAEPMLI